MADSASGSPDPQNPFGLTSLEQRVVDLLLDGLSNDEVAALLGVERRSVAIRGATAMRKCGARNGLHLARLIEIALQAAPRDPAVLIVEDIPSSLGL